MFGAEMKWRKGMEMAISTLVVIVLAVLVLIGLLVIWNQQTGIFSDFLSDIAGKTNVDNLVIACNSLVTQQAIYDYCCVEKEVKYKAEGKIKEEKMTCKELAEKSFTGERINKLNCGGAC